MFKRFAVLISILLIACSAFAAQLKKAKYVFLFIGDGMSLPQRMLAENYLNVVEKDGLLINTFPVQSPTTTRSASSLVTDSAASGTAIACGEKTKNGYLGVDAKKEHLTSVATVAKNAKKKVGILSSVTLNHATPAAFYAHNPSRGDEYAIALELVASNFDYFAGGGIGKHNDKKAKTFKGDIFDLAKAAGYEVFVGEKEFKNIAKQNKVIAVENRGGAMPYFIDKKVGLRLADFTQKGIEILDNPNGFFMMVEGGKIDWACHANDAATTLFEVLEFDRAVKVAYEFAKKHPNETLIVITGDHETGGLGLGNSETGYNLYPEKLQRQTCSVDIFNGNYKKALKDGEEAASKVVEECLGLKYVGATNYIQLFNRKAGVGWTSGAHTALPVITSAYGVNALAFSGTIDNTDIAKKLKKILAK